MWGVQCLVGLDGGLFKVFDEGGNVILLIGSTLTVHIFGLIHVGNATQTGNRVWTQLIQNARNEFFQGYA